MLQKKSTKWIAKLLLLFLPFLAVSQDQWNMELVGQMDRGDDRYAGSWAYVDKTTGKEYALLGTTSGTAIYDISEESMEELAFIPGPPSRWREITVLKDHAYIVTEGIGQGEGMQVIDLSNLPVGANLVTTFDSQFTRGHIISRDIYSEDPYVYVSGTCGNCGVEIVDVSSPSNPSLIGSYNPSYYIHDCHVRGNYLYAAAFWEGTIDIVDISDKTNPLLITQIETAGGNTHSSWTTEDAKHLIISAESDGLPARIWNIENLDNLFEVATYISNSASLTHNPYTRGDFVFFSHNTEGIRVVDMKDPALPLEVGYYDTFDGASGGFNGLWSACPYFPSGKIIGGNREDGLYVWTFNDTPANRLYLTIKDAISGEGIPLANLTLPEQEYISDETGQVRWATLDTTLSLSIVAEGFQAKDTVVTLTKGQQLFQDIYLIPSTVSTEETDLSFAVQVFPNPFKNNLTIQLPLLPFPTRLQIFNSLSQKVFQYNASDQEQIVVATAPFPAGYYWYVLIGENGIVLDRGGVVKK